MGGGLWTAFQCGTLLPPPRWHGLQRCATQSVWPSEQLLRTPSSLLLHTMQAHNEWPTRTQKNSSTIIWWANMRDSMNKKQQWEREGNQEQLAAETACTIKNKTPLILLDKHDQTLLKGAFLNNDIARLVPCWSLFLPNSFLPPYIVLVASYVFYIYTYSYVRYDHLLDINTINIFRVTHSHPHYLFIDILRFITEPQSLLSIPPNQ